MTQDPETAGELYFDHAATTPVARDVLEEMLPYFERQFGNPSSVHRLGQAARRALEEARERLADAVGAHPRGVVFTSGATEADNQALFGALTLSSGGLVVSATEHPAVLSAARRASSQGRQVSFVAPEANGTVPLEGLREALEFQAREQGTALVAVMHVNNETGVLTTPSAVAALAQEYGALFLCDAVQALGTERVDLAASGADLLTLSAHKVYGPKGAGALVMRRDLELPPLLAGGEQERGHRPGTHNLPAIVGMAAAVERAIGEAAEERERLAGVQRTFERAAMALPGVTLNGAGAERGVKHTNVAVEGVDGETLLMLLDEAGLRVSAGSACAAGSLDPSHVLLAMGLNREQAKASVRFSYGKLTTPELATRAAALLGAATEQSRLVHH
jgi:cysteine desulfurase